MAGSGSFVAARERRSDVGDGFAALLRQWRDGGVASAPIVMGIVNVTPDSFTDGGMFLDPEVAVSQGKKLTEEGAAILDIGGESTRGNATPVPADEEMRRVLPVIEGVAAGAALISIDTMKAAVAEAAIAAGAHIVNDIRGLQGDPDLPKVAARHAAGVIAMHNLGVLGSAKPMPGDPVAGCLAFFERSLEIATKAGIREDRIVLDPGFGFGKSPEQNLELLARFSELTALGFPVLAGTSRKSFIQKIAGREDPGRLIGTIATNVAATFAGAAIVRVHDVAEHIPALRMAAAIHGAGRPPATGASA
jgi:dihydropteroate synthase